MEKTLTASGAGAGPGVLRRDRSAAHGPRQPAGPAATMPAASGHGGRWSRRPTIAVLLALFASAGCSGADALPDWRLPIPDGTRVVEHAPVSSEERSPDAVRLIDDLEIGGDPDDPEILLYRPTAVVAAGDGTIYVAESGRNRIRVFGPDGEPMGSMGREGQGPGEFDSLRHLTVAGDRLVAYDSGLQRLSVWTLDGEHVDDHVLPSSNFLMAMQGLADGALVSNFTDMVRDPRSRVVARHAIDGAEPARLVEVAVPPPLVIRDGAMSAREVARWMIGTLDYPDLVQAVGARRTVFVSPAHEYQVLALAGSGEPLWALRVPWPRPPIPDDRKQERIDRASRSGDGAVTIDDFDWPPDRAVESLATDGEGNLYVFPTVPVAGDEPPARRPVDVYSPEGELMAAGWVPHTWSYALGDRVYGLRRDGRDEIVVVRSRLVPGARR